MSEDEEAQAQAKAERKMERDSAQMEEDEQLIGMKKGRRTAMQKALKDAPWMAGKRQKKNPEDHSPQKQWRKRPRRSSPVAAVGPVDTACSPSSRGPDEMMTESQSKARPESSEIQGETRVSKAKRKQIPRDSTPDDAHDGNTSDADEEDHPKLTRLVHAGKERSGHAAATAGHQSEDSSDTDSASKYQGDNDQSIDPTDESEGEGLDHMTETQLGETLRVEQASAVIVSSSSSKTSELANIWDPQDRDEEQTRSRPSKSSSTMSTRPNTSDCEESVGILRPSQQKRRQRPRSPSLSLPSSESRHSAHSSHGSTGLSAPKKREVRPSPTDSDGDQHKFRKLHRRPRESEESDNDEHRHQQKRKRHGQSPPGRHCRAQKRRQESDEEERQNHKRRKRQHQESDDNETVHKKKQKTKRQTSQSNNDESNSQGRLTDEDEPLPRRHDKRKGESKHEANFRAERPVIQTKETGRPKAQKSSQKTRRSSSASNKTASEPSDADASDAEESMAISRWPAYAKVRDKGLMQQNDFIKAICRDAIRIVETTIVTEHAWPELNRMAEYRRVVLLKACAGLQDESEEYETIARRIRTDDAFTKVIGKWVMDRLPHTRGPAKTKALSHIALFQLGIGDTCVERVQALMKNDRYIYPGRWGVDDKGKAIWVIRAGEIFLNPGLIAVLKSAYFATPTAFGHKFKAHYKMSHSTETEPEFPPSLVALAATGASGSRSLLMGSYLIDQDIRCAKDENEKFDGDRFKSVYDRHMACLAGVRKQNKHAYHDLMADLYVHVMGDQAVQDEKAAHVGALGLLDLSEYA